MPGNGKYEVIRWENPPDMFTELLETLQAYPGDWAVIAEKPGSRHADYGPLQAKLKAVGVEATIRVRNGKTVCYAMWPKPKRGRPKKAVAAKKK